MLAKSTYPVHLVVCLHGLSSAGSAYVQPFAYAEPGAGLQFWTQILRSLCRTRQDRSGRGWQLQSCRTQPFWMGRPLKLSAKYLDDVQRGWLRYICEHGTACVIASGLKHVGHMTCTCSPAPACITFHFSHMSCLPDHSWSFAGNMSSGSQAKRSCEQPFLLKSLICGLVNMPCAACWLECMLCKLALVSAV